MFTTFLGKDMTELKASCPFPTCPSSVTTTNSRYQSFQNSFLPNSPQEGERFALALGLENKPDLFKNCKEIFRRRADKHFDLTVHPAEQKAAMLEFIQDVTSVFPGYFNAGIHSNIEERVNALRGYAISYLQKSGNLKIDAGRQGGRKVKEPSPEVIIPIPSRPRPQPKPACRGAETNDDPQLGEVKTVKKPQNFRRPPSPPVEVAKPTTPVDCTVTGNDSPEPPTPVTVIPPLPSDWVAAFLAQCHPRMPHLAAAFCKAGIRSREHIMGMAKWKEEKLRKFLAAQITTSALEEETIVVALEKLN
ncbi:hypothetical protein FB45DRAFT_537265 [Roridomyces roridus]|uniref:Uncharacterized protein n=1 Tax=Roridomyces roridus TaxID=1738132 RepID=A0AAD7BTJ5_9AGAR|nr:hypothetical protein FB45DRAFT_537265 [Roridomyces roridus]